MPRDEFGRELADRVEWAQVRTLADAGGVTARWLEGAVQYHPMNLAAGPDSETSPLIDVLAEMNRSGFVTDWSQPGVQSHDGDAQRAVVTGYCDEDVCRRLIRGLASTEVIVLARSPMGVVTGLAAIPVTLDNRRVLTGAGSFSSRNDLLRFYSEFPSLAGLLAGAWEVHLIDPKWGRNSCLWPLVAEALNAR